MTAFEERAFEAMKKAQEATSPELAAMYVNGAQVFATLHLANTIEEQCGYLVSILARILDGRASKTELIQGLESAMEKKKSGNL